MTDDAKVRLIMLIALDAYKKEGLTPAEMKGALVAIQSVLNFPNENGGADNDK